MRFEPYAPEHLERLDLQPAQRAHASNFAEHALGLDTLPAMTIFDGDEPVACVGAFEIWPGRAIVWSYLSATAGRRMLPLTRAVRALLDHYGCRRMECEVATEFAAGHRWARLLGFEVEAERLRKYFPHGGDCTLYARIR